MTRWWGPQPNAVQTVTGSVVFGDTFQIAGVSGDVTISLDRPPYRVVAADDRPVPVSAERARAQPSRLLLARHQIVPFTGRERTLDTLAAWTGGHEPVAALLVHGAGGQGKTRLAAHVSTQCTAAGWAVWQVTHTPTPVAATTIAVSRFELPGGAVLVVVDYADRWPASALLALLTQLRDMNIRAGTRVRVLMLARSDGDWWPALADRAESDLGIEVDQWPLSALAADSTDDRRDSFAAAAAHFAAAQDLTPADWPVPDLTGDAFGQVLAVHMTALASVDAARHGQAPPTQPGAVSAYLLRREQTYWQQLHTRTEAPIQTSPQMMHRTVVAATLTGSRPRSVARRALAGAGFTDTKTATDQIIDDHTVCYPPVDIRTVFEPLHPDRLGEDLIAMSTPGHSEGGVTRLERDWVPKAITDLLTATGPEPPVWAATVVTVLVETARRWPHIATGVLYPLVREHPDLALAAGGATITRLAELPDADTAALHAIEKLLPFERHINLDTAAAAISTTLTRHRLTATTDPAEQARLHARHAIRLAYAGRREEALASSEEAVTIFRQLAQSDPDAHLPGLAKSLNDLGTRLLQLGRREEALAPSEEAVTIFRQLAQSDPVTYLSGLAASLNVLGVLLSELGRREDALPPTARAAHFRRLMAMANPGDYLPDLATSLNNLGARLAELGRCEEALGPCQEAVDLYRDLAQINPAGFLPDLAMSLSNLGAVLLELQRWEEALATSEDAARIRRQLVDLNPAAYLPDLAMSLQNLGSCLSGVGRGEEALPVYREAVDLFRQLALINEEAHRPDLAKSLIGLGDRLVEVGRGEDALPVIREARDVFRQLALTDEAYLPGLALSSVALSVLLMDAGGGDEALLVSGEAVDLFRQLALIDESTYLHLLALSLRNLGASLSAAGRGEEALSTSRGAVDLHRQLALTDRAAYLPDLAKSLAGLGDQLVEAGRGAETLSVRREAVDLYRQLLTDEAAYLPGLALSLVRHAEACVELRINFAQALKSANEAIRHFEHLAKQRPDELSVLLIDAYHLKADVLDGLGRSERAAKLRRSLVTRSAAEQAGRSSRYSL
jgi:tetratricopeptide (TPR) repeat protein